MSLPNFKVTEILRQSSDWKDFQSRLSQLTEKQKGDCFEALALYFLRLDPTYATKLKSVLALHEVPLRVRRHLNLPRPDEGIDLVAETKDNSYWAIQCKYKTDETKSLTHKELATFTSLAFQICKNIDLALVCTTAERFSHKLRLYGDRLTFCTRDVWRSLTPEFFDQVRGLLEGQARPTAPSIPRPHQERAIRNAWKFFIEEGECRGNLIMPCATGKTRCAYWMAQELKARSTPVAVRSLALISQTLKLYLEHQGNQANIGLPNFIEGSVILCLSIRHGGNISASRKEEPS